MRREREGGRGQDPGSRKETRRPQAWDAAHKNQSIGLDEAKKKKTALPPPVFPSEGGAQTGQLGSKSVPERKNTVALHVCVCRGMQYAGSPHPGLEFKWQVEKGCVGRGQTMTTIVLDLGLEA